jgi:hypothetical protein
MGTIEKFPRRLAPHVLNDAQQAAHDRLIEAMDALASAYDALSDELVPDDAYRAIIRKFDKCAEEFACAYFEQRRTALQP